MTTFVHIRSQAIWQITCTERLLNITGSSPPTSAPLSPLQLPAGNWWQVTLSPLLQHKATAREELLHAQIILLHLAEQGHRARYTCPYTPLR